MTASRNDERFKELLTEAFPAGEPSQELRDRVASGGSNRKLGHRGQIFRLAGATVLAIVCGIGFHNWNRWVAAEPLRQMQAALEKVQILYQKIHMTASPSESEHWEDFKTGNIRRRSWEIGQDGTQQLSQEELVRGGEQWLYNPKRNEITHQKYVPGPYAKRSGFTITDIRRDLMRSTGEYASFTDLGTVTKNNRPARKYRLTHNEMGNIVRIESYVDPQTNLPFHSEIYALRRGEDSWKSYGTVDLTYNTTPPADTFALNFPKTTPRRDLDKERALWQAQLEKGVARKTTKSGRQIVIRHFHVTPEGDVIILYTAGSLSKDGFSNWHTTLQDDQETSYEQYRNMVMGAFKDGKPIFPGTVYEGAVLMASGWVTTTPQPNPWQARTFTLTFHCKPLNPSPDSDNQNSPEETLTFTLPVSAPSENIVPELLPWANDSEELAKARARARGELEPGVKTSPEQLVVLTGVTDTIQSLAFSPDGRTLVSGAWQDGVRLWDAASGKMIGRWNSDTSGVDSLVFTQDGKYLALSGLVHDGRKYTENRIQMRTFPSGKLLWQQRLLGEEFGSTVLAFSPDGNQLHGGGSHIDSYGQENGTKYVAEMSSRLWAWDAQSGKQLQVRSGISTKPGAARDFQDVRNGQEITLPSVESNFRIEGKTISADGQRIAAIGSELKDKNTIIGLVILVWDAATGKRLHTLRTSGFMPQSAIAFSPNGNYLAVVNDRNIQLWNLQTGRLQTTLVGHGSLVMELAFSPDGRLLASGDLNGRIILWRMPER